MTLTEAPTRSVASPAVPARPTRRRGRLRLIVATLLVGLLAPLVAVATPAQARAAWHQRSAAEIRIDWYVLRQINNERAVHGIAPLRMNWDLRTSARLHNVTMADFDTMSHQLPGETDFARRMSRAGYNWSWAGENIAWNSTMTRTGVVVLENLMYNERAPYNGHRLNILNRQFRDVGVDVYMDRAHHKVWLTTDFGRS